MPTSSTQLPPAPPIAVSVTTKAITDAIITLTTAGVAVSSFLKDTKSYEVLFLCGLLILLWLYIRRLSNDVVDLRTSYLKCEEKHDAAEKHFDDYVEVTNISHVNMFGDLVAMAGQRRVGHLERDKETGAMIYIRNTSIPPLAPEGFERRGSLSTGIDPNPPTA